MVKKIQILLNALMNYNILYYIENVIIIKPIMLVFINFILFLLNILLVLKEIPLNSTKRYYFIFKDKAVTLIECKNNNL